MSNVSRSIRLLNWFVIFQWSGFSRKWKFGYMHRDHEPSPFDPMGIVNFRSVWVASPFGSLSLTINFPN